MVNEEHQHHNSDRDPPEANCDMRFLRLSGTLYRVPRAIYDYIVQLLDERALMISSQIALQEINASLRARLLRNNGDTN